MDIVLLTNGWDGMNRQITEYTLQLVMGEHNGIHKIKLHTLPQANKCNDVDIIILTNKWDGMDIVLLTNGWDGMNRQITEYTLQLVMGEQNCIDKIRLHTHYCWQVNVMMWTLFY